VLSADGWTALEAYSQARQVISDELGVDPGSELQRLYRELLAADASAASTTHRPSRSPVVAAVPDPVAPVWRDGYADNGGADWPADATATPGRAAATGPRAEPPGTIAIGTLTESSLAGPGGEAGAADADGKASPGIPRPAQLPADIGDFTGRETHVAHLCALLVGQEAAGSTGAVRIAVVNGAGGLGKTTLAVHAAHRVREEFPDGQLYVDLLGASAQPAEPGEVLARFLRDLGVAGDKVPARDDERAALFRTRLTGRRVLILLDNAQDAAQVRSLLPGSSSCAVLVTTRNRTPDLVSTRFVDLNVLEDTEALALFSRVVGEERAVAEPDATAEVLVACAGATACHPYLRGAARGAQPVAHRHAGRPAAQRAASPRRAEHRRSRGPGVVPGQLRQPQVVRGQGGSGPGLPAPWPVAGAVDQPGGRGGPCRRTGSRYRRRARDTGGRQPA